MIIVNSPLGRLLGFIFSLVILAIVYFAIVRPALDDADTQTNRALDQSQQAIDQGQKQIDEANRQSQKALGDSNKASKNATSDASKRLSEASKLTGCISDANGDVGKIQSCQAKFNPAAP